MRADHLMVHAKARRERADAVYRVLIAPLVRLFHKRPAPAVPLRARLA